MSPRIRTLLVLACVAVAGVTTLALLANRYRNMVPERSVLELPLDNPQVPRPVPADPAPEPPVPAEAPASEPEGPPAPAAAETAAIPVPSEADRASVEAFLTVRGALHALIENRPDAARVVAAEFLNEQTPFAKVPSNIQFFGAFRFARSQALEDAGMTPQEYQRVREAFTAWEAGKAAGSLGAAFAERGDEARKAHLEGLEPLDYKVEF